MKKDLFVGSDYVAPESFLKKYAQHRLTTNVSNWPVEILRILGEEYSWVVNELRPATVDIEKVDKDEGTGMGGVIVWASKGTGPRRRSAPGVNQPQPQGPMILIPFTVKAFQMSPLDIFVSGKKVLPLTPKRIAEELEASQIFLGPDRSLQGSQNSLLGQLSPPPEAFYSRFGGHGRMESGASGHNTYGSAGMPKEGGKISTQDSLILSQLLSTVGPDEMRSFRDSVYRDPASLAQFVRNKNVDVLNKIIKARPLSADDYKNITRHVFPKNVVLFEKDGPGQWKLTMYNDHFNQSETVMCKESDILETFVGTKEITEGIYRGEGFVYTVGHKVQRPIVWHEGMTPDTEPIAQDGVYLIVTENKQVEKGYAFKGFQDYDGNPLPYTLWYDGDCFSVQEKIQGERLTAEEGWDHPENALKEGVWGTFLITDEGGERHAKMPFKIHAVYKQGDRHWHRVMVRASDIFGHDVNFILDEGTEKWRSATGALDPHLASELGARGYFVPKDAQFITLGSQRIHLMRDQKDVRMAFREQSIGSISHERDRVGPATTVAVTCTDPALGHYRLEGNILEPIARSNALDIGHVRAKFYLVLCGCSTDDADEVLEMARKQHQVICMGMRPMKNEATVQADSVSGEVQKISKALKKDLRKEAAYIRDKKSVDALLSLNFVTPENLVVFLENIDRFKDVEGNLAKLLLMTRFGLEAVPEQAVANALKNLNMVIESLEMLRGVLGNEVGREGLVEMPEEKLNPETDTVKD